MEAAWATVSEEVAGGHQAYVVCPLVEESERVQAASASEELDAAGRGPAGRPAPRAPARPAAGQGEGSGHGASSAPGQLQVLVATTVIEVGVDVPNATVMVIEDADRFGIAQLHQLRGRVGRGAAPFVVLPARRGTARPTGRERLAALERTTDGFELAEVDLDLRGEGTILGHPPERASTT